SSDCRAAGTSMVSRAPICFSTRSSRNVRLRSSRHTIAEMPKQGERRELGWLFTGLFLSVLMFGFVTLAGEVMEGDTQAFDTRILRALRDPSVVSKPIGPSWL